MILDSRGHRGIYANALVTWNVEQNRLDLITASNYAGGTYNPAPSFTLLPEFATDITPYPRHPYDALATSIPHIPYTCCWAVHNKHLHF